jgi:hypothetical protein
MQITPEWLPEKNKESRNSIFSNQLYMCAVQVASPVFIKSSKGVGHNKAKAPVINRQRAARQFVS